MIAHRTTRQPTFVAHSESRVLHSDYVDLLQLHNRRSTSGRGQRALSAGALQRRKDQSIWHVVQVARGMRHGNTQHAIPVVQANLSMMDLRALDCGLLDVAVQHQAAVIARTPLCFGFLSGKVGEDTSFSEGDHRRRWSQEQRNRWAEGARRLFDAVSIPVDQTHTQVALRFCLSFPAVATVIPGILTPEEASENAAAGDYGPLLADQVGHVIEINRSMDFVVKRPLPLDQPGGHKPDVRKSN